MPQVSHLASGVSHNCKFAKLSKEHYPISKKHRILLFRLPDLSEIEERTKRAIAKVCMQAHEK